MPSLFLPDGDSWKEVKEFHVEDKGQWKEASIRLVEHNGKWRETFNNEGVKTDNIVEIHELKFRAGNKEQGDLRIEGQGLSDIIPTKPAVGAMYSFRSTLRDYFDNFGKVDQFGTELTLPAEQDGIPCYAMDAAKQQYMTANNSTRGYYDFLGLIGSNTPWGHWELGGKFKPSTWPSGQYDSICVYFTGTQTQCVSVVYNGAGTLFGIVRNGSKYTVVTLTNAVKLNEWTGFCLRHKQGGQLELMLHDKRTHKAQLTTGYWKPAPRIPIKMGNGFAFTAEKVADAFFMRSNTHADIDIVDNGLRLNYTGTAYRGSQPSHEMAPNTGKYYIEIFHETAFDMHYGVAEPGARLDIGAGVVGWCVNTINGRKFDHQTGGGTNWSTATPQNSTIGMLYDSDKGTLEIYVDGVKRPNPFWDNEITVPVKFIISGRAKDATTQIFAPRVNLDPSTWAHKPNYTDIKPVPLSRVVGGIGQQETFFTGYVSDFFIRSAPMINDAHIYAVIDPKARFKVKFTSIDKGDVYDATSSVIIQKGNHCIMTVPNVPVGNYWLTAEKEGQDTSTKKFFTVTQFNQTNKALDINMESSSIEEIRDGLIVAHKGWGGTNGGCVQDNVLLDMKQKIMRITAYGNLYTGPVKGVDRVGVPNGFNKRIGACVATRDYHGPGSYRVLCKFPEKTGVCSAFWTFHYEEGYPGSRLFNEHKADGLHVAGTEADGFYTVRNHEIDIEVPTALKTDKDQEEVSYLNARFNTWHGERRNWAVKNKDVPIHDPMYSPVNDPAYWSEYTDDFIKHDVNLNDGQYHEVRFDWHLDSDPRVVYYVDGVEKHTVRTHVPNIPGRFWVGLWFPSASTLWAGKNADWVVQHMDVKRIQIIPFENEIPNARQITETYPWDVYRDFKHIIYE
ncbi:UNVERIFIED_ORG: hypothetical protein GCAPEGMB_00439 [Vibrio phage V07]